MNLPLSWVAAAVPASQLTKRTAQLATNSASHIFGSLLQSPPAAGSGPSEATEPSSTPTTNKTTNRWEDRLQAVRTQWSQWVEQARNRFGLSADRQSQWTLVGSATGSPQVIGPEPVRTELEQQLTREPAFQNEVQQLAAMQDSSPLDLLPNVRSADSDMQSLRVTAS